jgi:hypothetical protein
MVKKHVEEPQGKGGLRVVQSEAPPRPAMPPEKAAELRELIRQLTEPARRVPQDPEGDSLPPAA